MKDEEALYERIKGRRDDIIQHADNGCEKAATVITLHEMLVIHADAPTLGLLTAAFNDFERKHPYQEPRP